MFFSLKIFALIILFIPYFFIDCYHLEKEHKFDFSDKIVVTEEKISDYKLNRLRAEIYSIKPNENHFIIRKLNDSYYNFILYDGINNKEFYFMDNLKKLYCYEMKSNDLYELTNIKDKKSIKNSEQKNKLLDIFYSLYKDKNKLIKSKENIKSIFENKKSLYPYVMCEGNNNNIYYVTDSENDLFLNFFKNNQIIKRYDTDIYSFINLIVAKNDLYYLLFNKQKEEYEYYFNLNKLYSFKTKPEFCKKINENIYLGVGNQLYINDDEKILLDNKILNVMNLKNKILFFYKSYKNDFFTKIVNKKINLFDKFFFKKTMNIRNVIIQKNGARNYFYIEDFVLSNDNDLIGYKFMPYTFEQILRTSSYHIFREKPEYIGINEHLHDQLYDFVSNIIWDPNLKCFVCFAIKDDKKLYFLKFKLRE